MEARSLSGKPCMCLASVPEPEDAQEIDHGPNSFFNI